MSNKEIYIFIGPPFSGKETQTTPLSHELDIPVFSMGGLIREARSSNPEIESAFQEYTAKGLHVPIEIKFGLLREKMDACQRGFILDNFPATQEDLDAFNVYVQKNQLEVSKVFYLKIGHDEMMKRFEQSPERGRQDDTREALQTRGSVQSEDRIPVLSHYSLIGKLVEIDGEQPISVVSAKIRENL